MGGGLSLEQERPLDWFDPATLPWQQNGRALLLFQAAWGAQCVCVCVSVWVQVHKIQHRFPFR